MCPVYLGKLRPEYEKPRSPPDACPLRRYFLRGVMYLLMPGRPIFSERWQAGCARDVTPAWRYDAYFGVSATPLAN